MSHPPRPLPLALVLSFLLLFPAGPGAGRAADEASGPVINLDLYAGDLTMTPADVDGKSEGRVTGQLPTGFEDSSAWTKSKLDYSIKVEDGQKFLSINVASLDPGPISLRHLIPDYADNTLFRLKFRARSVSNAPVQFGVRDVGKPWSYAWSQNEGLSPAWKEYEYLFSLDHNTQPMGFWLDVKGTGTVDISSLSLEPASKDQMLAELKAKYPNGGPENVLPNTRLPLGLQSGWTTDHRRHANNIGDYTPEHPPTNRDILTEPDPKNVGPSGFASLHLQSDDKVVLLSAPFAIPVPLQKYTASFYVKGTGTGHLIMRRNGKGIGKAPFTAGPDWTRVELPFDTRLGDKFYNYWVDFSGEIWIDAWQVNPGETATPYVTQLPTEISLACVAKETGPERIQFSDEPASVKYDVTAGPAPAPAGLSLHAQVVDIYGEKKELPPVPLKPQPTNEGQLDFAVFPQHPLGPFRIETWVADASGKEASPHQEIIIHRLHRPRYWGKDAPDSPFGTHVDADTLHITMAKAMGMNWVRSHDAGDWWADWYYLERQQGQWTFQDEAVDRYRKMHLKILATLVTAPPWASYFPGRQNSYFDTFYQPKDPEQYGEYAKAFATHYKGVIDAYDIWNEPWNAAWFGYSYDITKKDRAGYQPSPNSPEAYFNLVKAAAGALKQVDPKNLVVGLNSTSTTTYTKPYPDIDGQDWSILESGLKVDQYCDVLSYHQYDAAFQGFPGDSVEKGYQTALGPFVDRGVKKPVWMTEGSSIAGYISSGFYNYTLPYTDPEDVWNTANRACRFPVALLANGVAKSFLYSMATYSYFGTATENPWMALVTEDGDLHPAADAYSALAWRLEDMKFKKCLPLGADTYAYVFSGAGRSIAVLAPPQAGDALDLSAGAGWKVTDLFGNAVTETRISGNRLIYVETPDAAATLEQNLAKIKVTAGP